MVTQRPRRLDYTKPEFRAASELAKRMHTSRPYVNAALGVARHPITSRAALKLFLLPTVEVEVTPRNAELWAAPTYPPSTRPLADGWRAQAVLDLDTDDSTYLAGRRKQALRTNLNHARREGLGVKRLAGYDEWLCHARDIYQQRSGGLEVLRTIGPPDDDDHVVYMVATNASGMPLAFAGVVMLDSLAALFTLLSRPGVPHTSISRYYLHTELRSELKKEGGRYLTTGSALRLSSGLQYFQYLLGYEVRNLRLVPAT